MISVDKITLAVDNMAAMRNFYGGALGVSFVAVEMYGRQLYQSKSGSIEILLCPKDLAQVTADHNTVQLRFVVPKLTRAYESALKNGGVPLTPPQQVGGTLQAALRDPDGNSLELIQSR